MKKLAYLLPLLLVACTTARVSTVDERAAANAIVTTFETALLAAEAAGKIDAEKAQLARTDIAAMRTLIASTETTPLHWADIYQQAMNLGLKWAIATQ